MILSFASFLTAFWLIHYVETNDGMRGNHKKSRQVACLLCKNNFDHLLKNTQRTHAPLCPQTSRSNKQNSNFLTRSREQAHQGWFGLYLGFVVSFHIQQVEVWLYHFGTLKRQGPQQMPVIQPFKWAFILILFQTLRQGGHFRCGHFCDSLG